MTKNKKIYKYISIISLIIAIALIANLIIPSFTIASGESITISENPKDELIISTKINNANVGKSMLFVIKADSLAIPSTKDEMEAFAEQHIEEIEGTIVSTSQTFTVSKDGPGKYYAVILLMEDKDVPDPENEGNTVKKGEYTGVVSNSYTVKDDSQNNSGDNQGDNQGSNQGDNQGDNQGSNQENNQGDNQGSNQGSNQESNQGDNQGSNQENNQGDNQGNKPSETPATNPSDEPADEDVLQVKVGDDDKAGNNNPDDYKDLNDNKPADQNDNKPANDNDNKTNQNVGNNNNNQNIIKSNNNNTNVKNTTAEKKTDENIPQTGSNETAIIIAIVAFSVISLGSFVKYIKLR